MASLDRTLGELETIVEVMQRGIQSSSHLEGSERARVMIEARARLVSQIAAISNGIGNDPQLVTQHELAKEFAERLGGVRRKMAALHAKWRSSELTDKFSLYTPEALPVCDAIGEFVAWAKGTRRAI
jgi:hypothetical protein